MIMSHGPSIYEPPTTKNLTSSAVQNTTHKRRRHKNKNEKNVQTQKTQSHANLLPIPPFDPYPFLNLQWGFSFWPQFTERKWNWWYGGSWKGLQPEDWGVLDRARNGVRDQQESSSNAEEVHKLWDTEEGLGSMWKTRGFILQLSCCCGKSLQ